MGGITTFSVLWIFAIAANALAALRLFRLSLHTEYRCFWAFLLLQLAQNVLFFLLPITSSEYFWAYIVTEPLLWIVYFLVVRELYSLIFKEYRGIYTVSRWSMYAAWMAAMCLSATGLLVTWRSHVKFRTYAYYIESTERAIVFSLVLFLPLALFFLSRYPIELRRNTVVHATLYSALFLSDALVLFFHSFEYRGFNALADLVMLGVSGVCYLGWAILLSPAGETRKVARAHVNRLEEERLLQQLNAMNHALLQVIRK